MADHEHSKQGRFFLLFTAILFILTMMFSDWEERQYNPNQNPESTLADGGIREVFLKRNRQGHYVVNGKINDVDVVFLLDTGATDVAIPEKIADAIGLAKGYEMQVSTANGLTTAYDTKLDSLSLGNIRLYNLKASIIPYFGDNMVLLGMSALKHIEFSQQGEHLILRQRT